MSVFMGMGWLTALALLHAAPAEISLSSSTVMEGCPDATVVGTLSLRKPAPDGDDVFTLVEGAGSTHNYLFLISGNQLLVRKGTDLDYETEAHLSLRVMATETTDLTCVQVLTVDLTDTRQEDADGDGLSETDEEDIHHTSDVRFDTDGDGVGDGAELAAGTSPTDATAWPATWILGWGSASQGEQTAPREGGIQGLATGQNLSIAMTAARTLTAWGGQNTYGQSTIPADLGEVVEVAAGGDFWLPDSAHSLALHSDGSVVAWGYDDHGQIAVPAGLGSVVAIATGRAHALALQGDGTVVAWGTNPFGSVVPPSGLGDVVAIAAGGFYSLSLKGNGTVAAWGSTFNGTSWEQASVPVGLSDVVAISAGRFHSLALKNDGTVAAWGYNSHGQSEVPAGLDEVVAVAAGGFHSLALRQNGEVVAWGLNSHGQTTVPPTAQNGVKRIAAGILHSLALRGDPDSPEITSSAQILATPGVPITHQILLANAGPTQPVFSALGLPAGLAIDAPSGIITGTVPTALRRSFQIRVLTDRGLLTQAAWLGVATGSPPTAIALTSQGVLENSASGVVVGTLAALDPDEGDTHTFEWVDGRGSTDNRNFRIQGNLLLVDQPLTRDFEQNPAPLSLRIRARDAALNPYEQILTIPFLDDRAEDADGDGLSEAQEEDIYQTSDGQADTDGDGFGDLFEVARGFPPQDGESYPNGQILLAWGDNADGQLQPPPVLPAVIDLAAGGGHNLALLRDGTVAAWGANEEGQSTPPDGLQQVVAVAAGQLHSLALTHAGTVAAWGNNELDQTTVPDGLDQVAAIAAGGFHNLALKRDGTVVAWGYNSYGQATVPAGLTNVVAIAAGGFHSLALKSDGTVAAWGSEWGGALSVPAELSGVIAIAAGGFHGLALKHDGTVVAWGSNDQGQTTVPAALGPVCAIAAGWRHSLALFADGTVAGWGANHQRQADTPLEARHIQRLSAGSNHNWALRQDAGMAALAESAAVRSWPGETLVHPIRIEQATPIRFAAMDLPADLAINPASGVVTGTVTTGERRAARIMADTDLGPLSRVVWFDTANGVAPTAIELTAGVLAENAPAGTVAGTLGVTDPNAGDCCTLELASNPGAPDNYRFYIADNRLILHYPLTTDYDAGITELSIRVVARDSCNNTLERDFVLLLSDDRTEDADGDGLNEAMEEDVLGTSDAVFDDFRTADPDGDAIPSILEYACNLDPKTPGPPVRLSAGTGGTAGLPAISLIDGGPHPRLRLEYLRRVGPRLTYTPEFASTLDPAAWKPANRSPTVTPIDELWERCVVEDSLSTSEAPCRFGRVTVTYSTTARTQDADGDGFDQAMEEDMLGTSDAVFDDFRTADPDGDAIPSILEYACNLDPKTPGPPVRLSAGTGGTAGLPAISLIDGGPHPRLRLEYLRRVGPRLTYTPEFAAGLDPAEWAPATNPITVTPINAEWERCVVEDSLAASEAVCRFGRVTVSW